MEITGTLQRQAWINKVMPPVEQIRPGMWLIPVPMPDNSAVRSSPEVTAWQIAQAITWARPWGTIPPFLQRSAAGETLAHLIVGQAGGLVRTETEPASTQYWFPV